ncbi:hypothetical protein HDV00_012171 [Rhizophlyctis rosea]|nr:hypothetical protein HDV00_012171 [Rhizophlyctis rosea]
MAVATKPNYDPIPVTVSEPSHPTDPHVAQVAPAAGPGANHFNAHPVAEPGEPSPYNSYQSSYAPSTKSYAPSIASSSSVSTAPKVGHGVSNVPEVGEGAMPPVVGKGKRESYAYTGTQADKRAAIAVDRVRHILLWNNPLHSGAALTGLLGSIYILSHYSPLRIFSFLAAIAIGANLLFVNLWVHGGRMITTEGVKKPPTTWYLDNTNRNVIQHHHVREASEFVADLINVAIGWFASIVAVDNNGRSAEALVGALALYWLSGMLTGWTLLTAVIIIAFTAPILYINNKDAIDGQVGHAQAYAAQGYQNANRSVGGAWERFSTQAKGRMGGLKQRVVETQPQTVHDD